MSEMIELIEIIREKAKCDFLYARARLDVCEELIQRAEEREAEKLKPCVDFPMPNPDEEKPSIEEEPGTIFENSLNMGV